MPSAKMVSHDDTKLQKFFIPLHKQLSSCRSRGTPGARKGFICVLAEGIHGIRGRRAVRGLVSRGQSR